MAFAHGWRNGLRPWMEKWASPMDLDYVIFESETIKGHLQYHSVIYTSFSLTGEASLVGAGLKPARTHAASLFRRLIEDPNEQAARSTALTEKLVSFSQKRVICSCSTMLFDRKNRCSRFMGEGHFSPL
jgi:hypothetical protein